MKEKMSKSVLDCVGFADLDDYLERCAEFRKIDREQARILALAAVCYYGGNQEFREELRMFQKLESRWYRSVASGSPDYGVYDDDTFTSDLWGCWIVYSRKYLKMLSRPMAGGRSLVDVMKPADVVVDLGCGFGYTTAALKESFPEACVVGTNIRDTLQWKVARKVGLEKGFTVGSSPKDVGKRADLVFASEYFEHFQKPIEHLEDVLHRLEPRSMVIANSFGSRSVGHFDEYLHEGSTISNKAVGRSFNRYLRSKGYRLMETGFWNGRPAVWEKVLR